MRRLTVIVLLTIISACGGDALAPPNVLAGRFGGRAVELIATGTSVRVQWPCNHSRFAQPLIPMSDGAFSFSPTLVPLGNAQGTAAVSIHGIATSTTVDFEAVWLWPSGAVTTDHYSAGENQPADFSGFACI